jgi:hypothetical protein
MQCGTILRSLSILYDVFFIIMIFGLTSLYLGNPVGDIKFCVDFAGFYATGRLTLEGAATEAYNVKTFLGEISAFCGKMIPMPWAYPPPFDLAVAIPAVFPYGAAYGLIAGMSYVLYCFILSYLTETSSHFFIVRFLAFPSVFVSLLLGQFSLLFSTLIGWFALVTLHGLRGGGFPLGLLLVFKPHLAISSLLITIMRKRWVLLTHAGATAIFLAGVSTIVLGLTIWPAFFQGAAQVSRLLSEGAVFPLFRMVSVYAAAFTITKSFAVAFVLQIGTAAIFTYWLYLAVVSLRTRDALGYAIMLSVAYSPYAYDYDLAILSVSAALLLPTISSTATRSEKIILSLLYFFTASYGIIMPLLFKPQLPIVFQNIFKQHLSLAGLTFLMMVILVVRILFREKAIELWPGLSRRLRIQHDRGV